MKQKIVRERVIEITGNPFDDLFNALLFLERSNRLPPYASRRIMRHQVEYRLAVARHGHRLAAFDAAGKFGELVLRIED